MVPDTSKATSTSVISMIPEPLMAWGSSPRTTLHRHHALAPAARAMTRAIAIRRCMYGYRYVGARYVTQRRRGAERSRRGSSGRCLELESLVAEPSGAVHDELWVGVVVLPAQAQERIDVRFFEVQGSNRRGCGVTVLRGHQCLVDPPTIRDLKVVALRQGAGLLDALRKEVQQVAQRLQFVTLLIDALDAF